MKTRQSFFFIPAFGMSVLDSQTFSFMMKGRLVKQLMKKKQKRANPQRLFHIFSKDKTFQLIGLDTPPHSSFSCSSFFVIHRLLVSFQISVSCFLLRPTKSQESPSGKEEAAKEDHHPPKLQHWGSFSAQQNKMGTHKYYQPVRINFLKNIFWYSNVFINKRQFSFQAFLILSSLEKIF